MVIFSCILVSAIGTLPNKVDLTVGGSRSSPTSVNLIVRSRSSRDNIEGLVQASHVDKPPFINLSTVIFSCS